MSMHFHRLANQSNSVVRAGSGSAILLPFSNRARQRAEIRPTPFNSEWSAASRDPAGTGSHRRTFHRSVETKRRYH